MKYAAVRMWLRRSERRHQAAALRREERKRLPLLIAELLRDMEGLNVPPTTLNLQCGFCPYVVVCKLPDDDAGTEAVVEESQNKMAAHQRLIHS